MPPLTPPSNITTLGTKPAICGLLGNTVKHTQAITVLLAYGSGLSLGSLLLLSQMHVIPCVIGITRNAFDISKRTPFPPCGGVSSSKISSVYYFYYSSYSNLIHTLNVMLNIIYNSAHAQIIQGAWSVLTAKPSSYFHGILFNI